MRGLIILVVGVLVIIIFAMRLLIERAGKTIERKNKFINKYKLYLCLNNKWISLKESNRRLSEYFVENQIKVIAVYGLSDVGLNFCNELKNDGIEVKYAFDNNLIRYASEIPIYKLEDDLENVEAVVVTVPDEFEAIREKLLVKFSCPIISIEEIVYSI